MNQITVVGSTKKNRIMAHNAVAWYIKNFMPRMRTLDITVNLTKLDGAYGYCMEGDTNREFEIEVDKTLNEFDMAATIIHEMIHVKQYARRELQYKGNKTRWKKKWYVDIDYEDQPWEKEAHRLDEKYAVIFLQG